MDKYEYKIKADEIKELIGDREFARAADIADGIDWRRVKSVMMLCTISDLYKINRRFEDAKAMLLLAYERRPGGRTICYSLCELCIKMGDYVEALKYYKEFTQVAPKDSSRYILQYKLYEAQEVGLEERIAVLEELKKRDYREKWAYELAYLYHRAGLATRCVEECDELILWFGEGKYVVKAMELKMLHEPLTPTQQQMYEHRFERRQPEGYGEEGAYGQEDSYSQGEGYGAEGAYGQEDSYSQGEGYGAEGAYGQEDGYSQEEGYGAEGAYGQEDGYGQGEGYGQEDGYSQEGAYGQGEGYGAEGAYGQEDSYSQGEGYGQEDGYSQEGAYGQGEGYGAEGAYGQEDGYSQEGAYGRSEGYGGEETDGQEQSGGWQSFEGQGGADNASGTESRAAETELEIQVKPIDMGEYNTINLQAELAAGLKEVLGAENVGYKALVSEDVQEPDPGAPEARQDQEGTEVFFGETGELEKQQQDSSAAAVSPDAEPPQPSEEEPAPEEPPAPGEKEAGQTGGGDEKEQMLTVQPPKELADLLRQETDGQIRIVVPENADVEKQITGQMKIEDVLAEWEQTKKDNEQKNKEEVRRNVLRDTGNMFEEFETASRDGLLEKLEGDAAQEAGAFSEGGQEPYPEAANEALAEEEAWEIAAEEIEEINDIDKMDDADATDGVGGEDAGDSETMEDALEPLDAMEEALDTVEDVMEDLEESEDAGDGEPSMDSGEDSEEQPRTGQGQRAGGRQKPPVERDKEMIRALTREEKELYAPFIQSRHSREQLVKAIDNISMAAYTGNVVITGEEGMDTMTLAKNMIREVKMTDSNFSGKVAKITGQGLNQRNVRETLEGVNNGALIIQDAGGMNTETAIMLYKSLQQERVGVIVVMEDTKKAIQKLFLGTPDLFGCFTARMDLEAFSNDTLVSFGRRYAREMEYSIDDLGVLALHTRIEELQTIDHVVTVMEVKKIVDEAIRHARRKTLGHFMDVLLAKRYDDEDMIVLTEKDFVA